MKRKGFTLGEVLVSVMIISIMSAVLIPAIMERIRIANAAALRQQLQNLTTALLAFREHVGEYPLELDQLSSGIQVGDENICGNASSSPPAPYTSTDVAKWKGPYLTYVQNPSLAGIQAADGAVIQNVLKRSPDNAPTGGTQDGLLVITVSNVERDIALKVDSLVDPPTNSLFNGASRWGATAGSLGELTYYIAIRGC